MLLSTMCRNMTNPTSNCMEEVVDFQTITPCGESCTGCKKKTEGLCQGCKESDGHCQEWEQSQGCPIYLCAKRHDAKFCGICSEFPCEFMLRTMVWRKEVVSEMQKLARAYAANHAGQNVRR